MKICQLGQESNNMSWRIVVIANRAKLDLKMNHLVVRSDADTSKIHLSEISILIIENTAVSITAAVLCEMVSRKIKIIFCDQQRNPAAELCCCYGSHDTSMKIKKQIEWKQITKEQVWTEIVTEKISNQQSHLLSLGCIEEELLRAYLIEIKHNDTTNREAHAAKVYFNAIFGKDFSRTQDNLINAALNYGYSIILSAINREIVANGYLTQLGLFHDNMFNQFNLSCDLMEPFRPLVDSKVLSMELPAFEHDQKMEIVDILNNYLFIDGKKHHINNALKIYCKSVLDALNDNDISLIRFARNEL